MADTIGYIDLTNVSLDDGHDRHDGVFSHTTLQIDYTTGVVTVFAGGPLTFSGEHLPGISHDTASFTTFTLTQGPGGTYTRRRPERRRRQDDPPFELDGPSADLLQCRQ